MRNSLLRGRFVVPSLAILFLTIVVACGGGGSGYGGSSSMGGGGYTPPPPATQMASAYSMTKLVSDLPNTAQAMDPNLKNPWGIVFGPGAPVWVSNAGTQTSTLYDGTGIQVPLIVKIPAGANGASNPTGIVFSASMTDFTVTAGGKSGASAFIFAAENGTIIGWSPAVDLLNAVVGYDDMAGGASYKGLAIAANGGANFLYAADFHNNKVDVFDATFKKATASGGFTDPTLPAGYAPFGIQALQVQGQTLIYVAYAKQDSQAADQTDGTGLGLVNVFDVNGALQKHLIAVGGALNAPWGMAIAPANFGSLSNTLLVGNFGDGVINGYDLTSGALVGPIKDANGQAIATPGLWGIAFGNGARNQPATTLYFAAGVANEVDGLYGRIDLGATAPDTVAPTGVVLSAPADGSTATGPVTVTATASDNVGVTQVQFFAGTTAIGTATTAPFTITWDSTTTANGAAAITAQAQDAAGNLTTSAVVNVTVSNTAAPPPPPPPAATTLTQLQASIFTPKCSSCHDGSGSSLPFSMNLSTSAATFAALVGVTSEEVTTLKRVNPGDPTTSYIINKLEGTQTVGQRMPRGGPFLDQATIDTVKSWITAGALNN